MTHYIHAIYQVADPKVVAVAISKPGYIVMATYHTHQTCF